MGILPSKITAMKKLYTFLALSSLVTVAAAQSQRLVLVEEFTQASCPPCAAANPTFNAMLNANTSKAVSLKYQVNWPGVDPMNAQYSAVSGRVNYYGISSVPYALMDGVSSTGSNYTGYPNNLGQSDIDNEYAVPSPFDLTVTHTLSSDLDSVFITVHVNATEVYNSSSSHLRLQTALIEKMIHFSSAPGSNGETNFENVVRKMIPATGGSTLANNWVVGQNSTFTFAVPVPSYIYDINELAVVCFIQDNTDKSVQQAAFSSSPLGIQNPESSASAINLFPNPASSMVRMSLNLPNSSDVSINIYNAEGMLVRTEKRNLNAGKQEADIDVETLSNGMYFLELIIGDSKSVSRVSVMH
jgi:hypothetical protein